MMSPIAEALSWSMVEFSNRLGKYVFSQSCEIASLGTILAK